MSASDLKTAGLQVLHNEPLARYTSWRVGGPADRLVLADSVEQLQQFLQQLSAGEPLTFIGLGSNLLVRDGGVPGHARATASDRPLHHCLGTGEQPLSGRRGGWIPRRHHPGGRRHVSRRLQLDPAAAAVTPPPPPPAVSLSNRCGVRG